MLANTITLRTGEFALHRRLTAAIFILLGIRLYSMWYFPLTDTTEARYGELARKMVETGDWITLWHDYGIPFWAKPPLSTWLAAASFELFGINEFAARLPNLLLSFGILALLYRFLLQYYSRPVSQLSLLILGSMALFYLAAGTVMTDVALLFCCTLSMISFWMAIRTSSTAWGYGFFLSLGLGMLAKGPAAVVLSLLPIFVWMLYTRQWRSVLCRLPWLAGISIGVVIALPWYLAAEINTPGFLEYFFIGEHINRFLVSGWEGDLYGNPHRETLGTIWLFLLIDALPWAMIAIPYFVYRKFARHGAVPARNPDHETYLWCWFLTPLIFFSFAHNIILTYTITALPALAALLGRHLEPIAFDRDRIRSWVLVCAVIPALLLLVVNLTYATNPELTKSSGREISQAYADLIKPAGDQLAYVGTRRYSIEFYNAGRVLRLKNLDVMFDALSNKSRLTFALTDEQYELLSRDRAAMLERRAATSRYGLYQFKPVQAGR